MIPIFDGHNDTLTKLYSQRSDNDRSFFIKGDKGHIDLPRARESGLCGGIFAIFVPPPKSSKESDLMYGFKLRENGYEVKMRSSLEYQYAKSYTESVIEFLYNLEIKAKGQIKIIHKYKELLQSIKDNILAVILHFEGAEVIKKDLSNLQKYYNMGLRSLGLVWSRPNIFGVGVPFKFPHTPDTGSGLTDAGKKLVKECNKLGILIDLAHINEKGFWDVAKSSTAPLVVSHSGVYSLCHSTRNLIDKQIDAIGESNGIIGINLEPANIRSDGKMNLDTPLKVIIEHIDYITQRIGVEHVAFGSDFDGAKMPNFIKDITGLPNLIKALRNRGYDKESLEKIAYKNWLRVFKKTWKDI